MKPTLPTHINPQNGQCLPAAVALLFNDPSILRRHKAQPKKNGHLITELAHFLPDGVWFDVILSRPRLTVMKDGWFYDKLNKLEGHFIPLLSASENHVYLIIVFKESGFYNVFSYDLLNSLCKNMDDIDYLDGEWPEQVAILTDPETNAILSLTRDEVSHLIEF